MLLWMTVFKGCWWQHDVCYVQESGWAIFLLKPSEPAVENPTRHWKRKNDQARHSSARSAKDKGIAKGSVRNRNKGGYKRLLAFVRICSRLLAFSPLRLLAFVSVCLHLPAFARICLRPPLVCPPLRDTDKNICALTAFQTKRDTTTHVCMWIETASNPEGRRVTNKWAPIFYPLRHALVPTRHKENGHFEAYPWKFKKRPDVHNHLSINCILPPPPKHVNL